MLGTCASLGVEIWKGTLINGENVEALFSTHKTKTTYWRDNATIVDGGGKQIFSTELKNKVTWTQER